MHALTIRSISIIVLLLFVRPAFADTESAAIPPDPPLAEGVTNADAFSLDAPLNFLDGIPAKNADGTANLVVEIPAGTNAKWEVKQDGKMYWDKKDGVVRTVNYIGYIGNYGAIPRTKQADGDPIDLIALSPAFARGAVVPVRIIGVALFKDDGEQDDKLLGVVPGTPLGNVKTFAELNERFPGVAEIVQTFFSYYKGPDGGGMVFEGFRDEVAATELLEGAATDYNADHPQVNK